MSAFGGILVADGVIPQTVETTGPLTKLNCFTANSGVRGSDGAVVEDVANDQIKLKVGGYEVDFCIDFTPPAQQSTYQFHVRVGNDGAQFANELNGDVVSQVDTPLITDLQGHAKADGFFEVTAAMLDSNGFAPVAVYMEVSADESSSSSTSVNSSSSTTNSSSSSSNSSSSSSTTNSSSSSSPNSSSSSYSTSSSSSVLGGPVLTVVAAQLNIVKIF